MENARVCAPGSPLDVRAGLWTVGGHAVPAPGRRRRARRRAAAAASREVLIDNVPAGTTEASLRAFLGLALRQAGGAAAAGEPLASLHLSGRHAFVGARSDAEALALLACAGICYRGTRLRVKRPSKHAGTDPPRRGARGPTSSRTLRGAPPLKRRTTRPSAPRRRRAGRAGRPPRRLGPPSSSTRRRRPRRWRGGWRRSRPRRRRPSSCGARWPPRGRARGGRRPRGPRGRARRVRAPRRRRAGRPGGATSSWTLRWSTTPSPASRRSSSRLCGAQLSVEFAREGNLDSSHWHANARAVARESSLEKLRNTGAYRARPGFSATRVARIPRALQVGAATGVPIGPRAPSRARKTSGIAERKARASSVYPAPACAPHARHRRARRGDAPHAAAHLVARHAIPAAAEPCGSRARAAPARRRRSTRPSTTGRRSAARAAASDEVGGSRPPTGRRRNRRPRRPTRARGPPRQRRATSSSAFSTFSTSQPVHDAVRSNDRAAATSTCGLPARPADVRIAAAAARTRTATTRTGRRRPRRSRRGRATGARSRPRRAAGRSGSRAPRRCRSSRSRSTGPAGSAAGAASGIRRAAVRARCGPSRGGGAAARAAAPTCRARASR